MAEDTRFQDAVDALRRKDRARAQELLTEVIKSDQKNVTYWIWLSAAVDTTKERIYCLQTVLRLDPENAIAKRGLVLLGGSGLDLGVVPQRFTAQTLPYAVVLLATAVTVVSGVDYTIRAAKLLADA